MIGVGSGFRLQQPSVQSAHRRGLGFGEFQHVGVLVEPLHERPDEGRMCTQRRRQDLASRIGNSERGLQRVIVQRERDLEPERERIGRAGPSILVQHKTAGGCATVQPGKTTIARKSMLRAGDTTAPDAEDDRLSGVRQSGTARERGVARPGPPATASPRRRHRTVSRVRRRPT